MKLQPPSLKGLRLGWGQLSTSPVSQATGTAACPQSPEGAGVELCAAHGGAACGWTEARTHRLSGFQEAHKEDDRVGQRGTGHNAEAAANEPGSPTSKKLGSAGSFSVGVQVRAWTLWGSSLPTLAPQEEPCF